MASPSPAPANRQRFVQWPTEAVPKRSAEVAWGFTSPLRLEGAGRTSDAGTRARVIATVAALLYRLTQQVTIALDVFLREGAEGRVYELDVEVAGDASIASLTDETARALGRVNARPATDLVAGGAGASNVAVTFVADPLDALELGSLDAGALFARDPIQRDAHFVFMQRGDAMLVALACDERLVTPSAATRLARRASVILTAAMRDAATVVDRLPLLDPEEVHELTVDQDSGIDDVPPLPVHRLFEALARTQPSRLAASFNEKELTYAELDERSHRLAHHLVACGVGPGVPVAVCVRPSLDVLVAMLAIWEARGVYFPLDPTHPEALVGRMLDEARPRLVVTVSALSGLTATFPQVLLDAEGNGLEACAATPLGPSAGPDDDACLFYTSGTTGKPKGVVLTQGNLAQYIHSAARKYGFRADDVFISLARYTFSISLFELVSPLCCGGAVRVLERDHVLTPEHLLRALGTVTVVHAGPSLLGSLVRYIGATPSAPHSLPRMRHASSGGDIVSPSTMDGMKSLFPDAELFVIYGCTEVSVMGTTFPVPRGAVTTRTLVGKPFPNVTVRVLDASRDLAPFGVVGEIAIGGKGVARGYLDRPELDAEKFASIDGQRFYFTGDVGRLQPDGNLEILGRRDFQVQLRGIRIELAGIEKTVLDLGLAAQCAVVPKTIAEGDVRLVAYVVKPKDGGVASFRRALAAELPDYMIPHRFVALDALPLTVNGKLDRVKLRDMPSETPARPAISTARGSPREHAMAEAIARVLGLAAVGLDDNFFDLGGDSLLGVVALAEIARVTGVTISPRVLFEGGTVRALAGHVENGRDDAPRPIRLGGAASGPPVFMLFGVHIYRPLAMHLAGRCAPYGVYVQSEVDGAFHSERGYPSIDAMAREYLEAIRSRQTAGPYRLVGYSFGGIIAYEVAQLLRAAGEEVRMLALVDTYLPEWSGGWRFRLAQLERLRSAAARDVVAFAARRLKLLPALPEFRYAGHENLGPLEAHIDASKNAAANDYLTKIRPFPGHVTLFVARDRLRADPLKSASGGWAPFVRSLAVHELDTDHFRMMSDEPYVTEIAGVLAKQLAGEGGR